MNSKKFNLRRFKIGDWVKFVATSSPGYNEKNHRILFRDEFAEQEYGIVVGVKIVQLGDYNFPSVPHPIDGEVDPPYLDVKKTIHLWEVKIGLLNKPLLVEDQDINERQLSLEYPYVNQQNSVTVTLQLPTLAKLPKYKRSGVFE